jgi:hypothetical protein
MNQPDWEDLGEIRFEPTTCSVCGSDNAKPRYRKKIRDH